MSLRHLFITILISCLLGFGGLSSLPVLRGQLQAAGLQADSLVLNSLAIGNITPGPNGLYLVVVGFLVAGIRGAAVSTLAVLIPPFLVLLLERLRSQLVHLRRFRAVMHSLSLSVIALLIPSSGSLVLQAASDALGVAMVASGAVLLAWKVPPLGGICFALLVGSLLSLVPGLY